MGGPKSGQRADPREADLFPWLVTLGCLVVALILFGHSTMPALAEREALERVEKQKVELLQDARRQAADLRARERELGRNPEALLIELDRQGLSPDDAHAEPR